MTGDPDLRLPPEHLARLAYFAIALTQVDPVSLQPLGESNAVVDDECHVARAADFQQRLSQTRGGVLVHPFDPELECRDWTGIKRTLEPCREGAPHLEWRNQI
jgi:hypothetical protein